jgi:hypothetical protein
LHFRVVGDGCPHRPKQQVASLRQSATDNNQGEVDQRRCRRDGNADSAARTIERSDRNLVAGAGVVGKCARGRIAPRPPAMVDRPGGDGWSAGDPFQAPSAAAWAQWAVGFDHNVADVATVAGPAVDNSAAQY